MSERPPSESQQLAFLGNAQRLLEEGQFTATYKFALLTALVDLAVERGRDDGGSLRIPLTAVAEKFVEYFWAHTSPYRGGMLFQNKGRNITVLGMLGEMQKHAGTLAQAQRRPEWPTLLARVAREVRGMPLFRLQTLRSGGKLVFLYEEKITAGAIELLPGIAFCLRRFSGFIRTLARHGWLNEIRRNTRNAYLVGDAASLEEHLFPDERIPLGKVRDVLEPIQQGRCFYCGERLRDTAHDTLHVDHFVPFALYPGNLAHNLVLAHAACNGDKSDLLADVPHLDHWVSRNNRYGSELGAVLAERGIVGDLESTVGVARWAYGRAEQAGALLWVRRAETRPYPRGISLPI